MQLTSAQAARVRIHSAAYSLQARLVITSGFLAGACMARTSITAHTAANIAITTMVAIVGRASGTLLVNGCRISGIA